MHRHLLACSTAAIALSAGFAVCGAQAQDEGEFADDDVEVIITVGTRRDARSASNTPAPIDVISTDEVLNQGDSDIVNILRTSVPSYNVNTQPISDAATLIRPANLRGLAPDSTLVLVNNKRRHRAAVITFLGGGISDGSQGPDISVIPSIAIKQVEVLRDGASSQYGSDAIAGVINFVLKDAPEGGSFEAEWGETYEGDGEQYSVAGNIGMPINIGRGGFLNISSEYSETDATNRSVQRDDAAALIAAGNTDVADPAQIWGQPNVNSDWTIFANGAIPFSDAFEVYSFGNFSERTVEGGFFFRNPNTRPGVFSNDGGETLLVGDLTPDGSGACPVIPIVDNVPDQDLLQSVIDDPDCFVFNELFPGGFTPRFGGQLEDKSMVIGARGEVPLLDGTATYSFSYTWGRNDIDFFINNTVNASLGPDTPTSFRPGGYSQIDNNYNLDLTYAIPNNMFASDIGIAVGAEHREETFEIRAGDPESFEIGPLAAPTAAFPAGQGFSSSSNGFGGFTEASAGEDSQSNYAIYFDTETDITDRFVFQGAVRFEDFYDSFGTTTNYKVGGLYELTENLTLRSTWSTGFHAPTAGQANVTNITTQFSGGQLQDEGTVPLSSVAGQFLADRLEQETGIRPELGPEESKNFSVGAAIQLGAINLTADFFRITIDDRIATTDQLDFIGELEEFAAENGVTVPNGATTSQILNLLDGAGLVNADDFAGAEDLTSFRFFTNVFDTKTQGLDIVANTDLDLYEGSSTSVAAAFNWTDTEVTDRGLDTAAPISIGRVRQIEDSTPAVRGNVSVNHFHGPFRGLARVNYYGSFFECHLDATNDDPATGGCDLPHEGDPQVTVDLEAGYTLNDRVEIALGAQNAFDSYPDELDPSLQGVAGSQYPAVAPGGYSGGFYYVRMRSEF
ncbi:MAG: TonB-dependent receptor [Caulobacterales bacterium]|nr:TonB-dependent receptor [Caulobacterales bacterium]